MTDCKSIIIPTMAFMLLALAAPDCAAQQAARQQDRPQEQEQHLEETVVIGTRTERSLDDTAGVISLITAADMERELAGDIADLVRFQPGIAVGGTGSRWGLSGFNIRGIGENRVLTTVDGIRTADEFSFGPYLSARRNHLDLDSMARVEIARGPISSLYGSDALGGVVAFTTMDARAFLRGQGIRTSLKNGYASADSSLAQTLTTAFGGARGPTLMLQYTDRTADESRNGGTIGGQGAARELPDPQDFASSNILARASWTLAPGQSLTLSSDRHHSITDAQILSRQSRVVRGYQITDSDASDRRERERTSLSWRHYGSPQSLADAAQATIYHQQSASSQHSRLQQTRLETMQEQRRWRTSEFAQQIWGINAQLSKHLGGTGASHLLTFGVEYHRTDSISQRSGDTVLANGASAETQVLPTRDFPATEVASSGVYLQDEISLGDGRLSLIPSLRHDAYDARVRADAVYFNRQPGREVPDDYSDSATTLRLSALRRMSDAVTLFGLYSQGFRAPPYDDVNGGFTNPVGRYKVIHNHRLQSERSTGLELGVRLHDGRRRAQLSLFRNDYEGFIESGATPPQFAAICRPFRGQQFCGYDPADGFLAFQSVNLPGTTTIGGVEFSGELPLAAAWGLRGAAAWARGETDDGTPLDSVEPLGGVLGLRYAPARSWDAELVWTLASGKDAADVNDRSHIPAGYGILDLLVQARFLQERLLLSIGLFNITDKYHIRWADTAAIGSEAPARFSQPGFNSAINLSMQW